MGGCDSCSKDDFEQIEPETKPERRPKTSKTTKSGSDGDDFSEDFSDSEEETSTSRYLDPSAEQSKESSVPPDTPHTKESKEKAISGFREAVNNGNDSLVMYFVEENPNLDLLELKFENGNNCLQVAVKNKSYNLIYYLLTNGVSPNAQNPSDGETALHTAVRVRDVKVVTLLCKFQADPKITNNKYETAIQIASDNRDEDIIELLAADTQNMIRDRIGTVVGGGGGRGNQSLLPGTRIHGNQESNDMHDIANDILASGTGTTPNIPDKQYYDFGDGDKDDVPTTEIDYNNTFEKNLTGTERKKLDTVKVARSNPFSKLKRGNTKKALEEIQKIADNKDNLPVLEAWLEKKSTSITKNWQKRWAIVRGSYLLWSDIQRSIKDPKNVKERRKFNNSINLMTITDVSPVTKGKTQRKFTITVGGGGKNKRKEYLWKCATKEDREYWVNGLKKHINHQKSIISFLGTK